MIPKFDCKNLIFDIFWLNFTKEKKKIDFKHLSYIIMSDDISSASFPIFKNKSFLQACLDDPLVPLGIDKRKLFGY